MKRGPKFQPTALKVLRNNPGGHPLPKDEPKPPKPQRMAPAPRHLDKHGKWLWKKEGSKLMKIGVLTELDYTALTLLCETYSRFMVSGEEIARSGMTIMTGTGTLVQSPHLQIHNKAHDQLVKLLTEFGGTPASRPGIKARTPGEKTKAQAFKDRKKNG